MQLFMLLSFSLLFFIPPNFSAQTSNCHSIFLYFPEVRLQSNGDHNHNTMTTITTVKKKAEENFNNYSTIIYQLQNLSLTKSLNTFLTGRF